MAELKPYDLKSAQDMVRAAIRRDEPRHKKWRALEALYRTGSLELAKQAENEAGKIDLLPEIDRQVVNLVLPHINVMLASIVDRDPKHLAEPVGGDPDSEDLAKTAEGVVSYFWHRTQGTMELRDATQDALLLGNGFLKSGWAHVEHDPEPDEPESIAADLEAAELAVEAGATFDDELEIDVQPDAIIDVDEPYLEYASPYDIFVPPNANRIETTRWVCHRVSLPIDEIKANDAYDSSVEIKPDGQQSGHEDGSLVAEWKRQSEEDVGWEQNERAMETATIFEFYDMRARRLMVFQMNSDKPLYDDELPYSHRYPPFVHIVNYKPNGSSFWGFGDLENVARVQALFNELTALQVDNARRSGSKYLVHQDVWTDEMQNALEDDTPDVVARVNAPNGLPLSEVIHTVQREGLSGDVYQTKDEFEEYIRKILGINDFQAGGVGADRMSATAAAVVDGIASLRAQDKIAAVERGAATAGLHILLLAQEFLSEPRVVRIMGPDGAFWPEVSADRLRGEYMVTIEGGSTQAVNPQTREQRGMRTLSEILPLIEQYGMDPTPLLRQGLKDLGYDPDLVLRPLPPEAQPQQGPEGGGQPAPDAVPEDAPAAGPVEAGGPPAGLEAQLAGDIAL